ncbi:alpha-tubulin [Stylonychia lemnae]|uniref:Alpha-tubulin n=1 Tax=Stylonychia lemnae TaxID=5949 RepID=A0A077ZUC8_STYLE|nr:alpha-tubulin [Stylonychia lemnae]|eukprot:CDW72895.1 alpha-tubulin [Stylonychia lemnae]
MREIIQVNIGEAGIRIGDNLIRKLYSNLKEQDIFFEKLNESNNQYGNKDIQRLYQESMTNGLIKPRAVFFDLDPESQNILTNSIQDKLINTESTYFGLESSANNCIRGEITIGKDILENCMEIILRQAEQCDNIQGVIVNHSISGGTGSGLGGSLISRIQIELGIKACMSNMIFPSNNAVDEIIVSPYNAVYGMHTCMEYLSIGNVITNVGLQNHCRYNKRIENPGIPEINDLITDGLSILFQHLMQRNTSGRVLDLQDLCNSLQQLPDLRYMTPSLVVDTYSSLMYSDEKTIANELTKSAFDKSYQFNHGAYSKLQDAIPQSFQVSSHMYSGQAQIRDVMTTLKQMTTVIQQKSEPQMYLMNDNFFVSIQDSLIARRDEEEYSKLKVFSLSQDYAMVNVFQELAENFDKLYSKRAFLHWYLGEGPSEGFFGESREDLANIIQRYEENYNQNQNSVHIDE